MPPNQRPSATTSVDMVVKTSSLLSQRRPPIPRTSYEMERLWRNMKVCLVVRVFDFGLGLGLENFVIYVYGDIT